MKKKELTERMKDWLTKCAWCDGIIIPSKYKDVFAKVDDRIADKRVLKHFEKTIQYAEVADRKIRTIVLWKGFPEKEEGYDICFNCCSQECADKLGEVLKKEIGVSLLLPKIGHQKSEDLRMDGDKQRESKKIEKKELKGILLVIFAVGTSKIFSELTTWSLIVRLLVLFVILGVLCLIFYLIKTILKGR